MQAISVGAFDVEHVHIFHGHGIAQNSMPATAHVAGEKVAIFFAVLTDIQHNLRGT